MACRGYKMIMAMVINKPVNTVGRQPLPMATFPKLPVPLLFGLPFGLAELLLDPLALDFPASAFDARFVSPLPVLLCFSDLLSFLAMVPPVTTLTNIANRYMN